MKDCSTEQEKIDNVRNAFAVQSGVDLKDRRVILVDDIYHTGFTINEVGTTLFKAQVKQVLGLVATKTVRGYIICQDTDNPFAMKSLQGWSGFIQGLKNEPTLLNPGQARKNCHQ